MHSIHVGHSDSFHFISAWTCWAACNSRNLCVAAFYQKRTQCGIMSDAMIRTFWMPKWSSPIPAGTSAASHALTEAKNKWLALDRPDRLNDCSRVARCSASAAQPVIFLQHHIISYLHITYIILINLIYPLRYKKPEIIPWKSPMHEARTPEAVLQELPCIVPSVQL